MVNKFDCLSEDADPTTDPDPTASPDPTTDPDLTIDSNLHSAPSSACSDQLITDPSPSTLHIGRLSSQGI